MLDAFYREPHGHEVNCADAEDAFLFDGRHVELSETVQARNESLVLLTHGFTVNCDMIVDPLDTRKPREYHIRRSLKNFRYVAEAHDHHGAST